MIDSARLFMAQMDGFLKWLRWLRLIQWMDLRMEQDLLGHKHQMNRGLSTEAVLNCLRTKLPQQYEPGGGCG